MRAMTPAAARLFQGAPRPPPVCPHPPLHDRQPRSGERVRAGCVRRSPCRAGDGPPASREPDPASPARGTSRPGTPGNAHVGSRADCCRECIKFAVASNAARAVCPTRWLGYPSGYPGFRRESRRSASRRIAVPPLRIAISGSCVRCCSQAATMRGSKRWPAYSWITRTRVRSATRSGTLGGSGRNDSAQLLSLLD